MNRNRPASVIDRGGSSDRGAHHHAGSCAPGVMAVALAANRSPGPPCSGQGRPGSRPSVQMLANLSSGPPSTWLRSNLPVFTRTVSLPHTLCEDLEIRNLTTAAAGPKMPRMARRIHSPGPSRGTPRRGRGFRSDEAAPRRGDHQGLAQCRGGGAGTWCAPSGVHSSVEFSAVEAARPPGCFQVHDVCRLDDEEKCHLTASMSSRSGTILPSPSRMGASCSTSGSLGSMSRSEQNLKRRCSCARRQMCAATPRDACGTRTPPVSRALAPPSSRLRSRPSRVSAKNAIREARAGCQSTAAIPG